MQKRYLSFLLAGLTTIPALNAQTYSPITTIPCYSNSYSVPAEYSKSGKPMIVVMVEGEDRDDVFNVYDEDLNNVATINLPHYGYELITPKNYNTGSKDNFHIVVSQTLFNDDEEYEYITYSDDDSQTEGFVVRTASGNELQKILLPTGHSLDGLELTLIGDKTYLTAETRASGGDYLTYYAIDKNSGLRQVGMPLKVNVSPTIISRGGSLNVVVRESNGSSNITVTDMQGRTVYSSSAKEAGVYQIPGNVMSTGMNVVTVTSQGKAKHSSKVIVR